MVRVQLLRLSLDSRWWYESADAARETGSCEDSAVARSFARSLPSTQRFEHAAPILLVAIVALSSALLRHTDCPYVSEPDLSRNRLMLASI